MSIGCSSSRDATATTLAARAGGGRRDRRDDRRHRGRHRDRRRTGGADTGTGHGRARAHPWAGGRRGAGRPGRAPGRAGADRSRDRGHRGRAAAGSACPRPTGAAGRRRDRLARRRTWAARRAARSGAPRRRPRRGRRAAARARRRRRGGGPGGRLRRRGRRGATGGRRRGRAGRRRGRRGGAGPIGHHRLLVAGQVLPTAGADGGAAAGPRPRRAAGARRGAGPGGPGRGAAAGRSGSAAGSGAFTSGAGRGRGRRLGGLLGRAGGLRRAWPPSRAPRAARRGRGLRAGPCGGRGRPARPRCSTSGSSRRCRGSRRGRAPPCWSARAPSRARGRGSSLPSAYFTPFGLCFWSVGMSTVPEHGVRVSRTREGRRDLSWCQADLGTEGQGRDGLEPYRTSQCSGERSSSPGQLDALGGTCAQPRSPTRQCTADGQRSVGSAHHPHQLGGRRPAPAADAGADRGYAWASDRLVLRRRRLVGRSGRSSRLLRLDVHGQLLGGGLGLDLGDVGRARRPRWRRWPPRPRWPPTSSAPGTPSPSGSSGCRRPRSTARPTWRRRRRPAATPARRWSGRSTHSPCGPLLAACRPPPRRAGSRS